MSVILIEKDPFVEAEEAAKQRGTDTNVNVRRPLYGIEVKESRPAFMSLFRSELQGSPSPISLLDSSAPGGYSTANHNFILQGLTDSRQEKVQVVETFGDHYAFFFGSKPIVVQVQGMLINTKDFNWKNEFLKNYELYLRGTKCVENKTRVFLGWDDVLAQGYMMNCSVTYMADNPYLCPFSFQLLLAKPPLDLSTAEYVSKAEDARLLESDNSMAVEYIGAIQAEQPIVLDEYGEVVALSQATINVPQSIDNIRSATWISGKDPKKSQWKTESESLLDINVDIAEQAYGVDAVTARRLLRENPAAFPLAQRTDSVVALNAALGAGVSNAVAVIPDSTELG